MNHKPVNHLLPEAETIVITLVAGLNLGPLDVHRRY